MKISWDQKRSVVSVCVSGSLKLYGDPARQQSLSQALERALAAAARRVELDLQQLTRLDSTGIAALAQFARDCRTRGVRLAISLPSGTLGDALRLVRIFDGAVVRRRPAAAVGAVVNPLYSANAPAMYLIHREANAASPR